MKNCVINVPRDKIYERTTFVIGKTLTVSVQISCKLTNLICVVDDLRKTKTENRSTNRNYKRYKVSFQSCKKFSLNYSTSDLFIDQNNVNVNVKFNITNFKLSFISFIMAFIPGENSDYHSINYWNNRFDQEENYEWCGGYNSFQSLFNQYVPKTDSILIVGNGNSNLPIDLYNDSYRSITSMDYTENSIEKLRLKSPPEIQYVCADMRFMKFDRTFDTVIEKSALDVLFTSDSSPWSVSERTESDVTSTLNSIKMCLKTDGQFISVTFAEPFFRKKHFINYWNNLSVETFGDMFHYYFIVCRS